MTVRAKIRAISEGGSPADAAPAFDALQARVFWNSHPNAGRPGRLQPKNEIEMLAIHRRKVLRALARIRARDGIHLNLPAWTAAAADIAAGIHGEATTAAKVESTLVWMGVKADPSTLATSAAKSARERQVPGFRLSPSAVVGALVGMTSAEVAEIKAWLGLKRIAITPIDHDQATKVANAVKAKARRAERARPRTSREAEKPWEAYGKSRAWWYDHREELQSGLNASALPNRGVSATKSVQLLGNSDDFQSRTALRPPSLEPLSGNGDEISPDRGFKDE